MLSGNAAPERTRGDGTHSGEKSAEGEKNIVDAAVASRAGQCRLAAVNSPVLLITWGDAGRSFVPCEPTIVSARPACLSATCTSLAENSLYAASLGPSGT